MDYLDRLSNVNNFFYISFLKVLLITDDINRMLKKLFFFRIFCIIVLLFISFNYSYSFIIKKKGKPFLFPMPVHPMVSSGFGERSLGILHGGTDFRTYAINGIPLVAMEDGYIDTIHGHPQDYGFGLALFTRYYYKNYRSVYGHIQDLSPKYHMSSAWRLYNLMAINSYYSVKMPKNMMRVVRGEIIAYTGERGIGVEHFHYELRDANNNYLNSFHPDYVSVEKKEKPVFHSVYLVTEGYRMGKNRTSTSFCRLKAEKSKAYSDVYRCHNPLPVDGRLYIKVRAKDNTNAINNHSVYSMTAILDNQKIFEFKMDRMKHNERYLSPSLYDASKTHGWPYFYGYNLYLSKNYRKKKPSWIKYMKQYGVIDTSAWKKGEKHVIKLIAEDVTGNKSYAYIKITKSKGRPYRPGGVGYNKKPGMVHKLNVDKVKIVTTKLRGWAYLAAKRKYVKKIWFLRRTGHAYQISFIRGNYRDSARVFFPSRYSGKLAIYNQYGKHISSRYSKKDTAYYADIKKGQTLFLAKDISAPSFGYPLINGPLEQEHYVVPVSDYGSGLNWNTFTIFVDGVKLSKEQIRRWNIHYDRSRKSVYIPSGIEPKPDSFHSGKEHHVLMYIYDNAWNRSKKWQGLVLLKE